jgi:hydrogenase maturation protein HypF
VEAVGHLARLFEIRPAVVAHDLHPQYRSTMFAVELEGVEHVAVQHHHAHVAACLADAGHPGPAIGVALDGTGLGSDGTVWGGEFLLGDLATTTRVGWFAPVALPGGDAAAREPWRMAAVYLDVLGEAGAADLAVAARQLRWEQVLRIARSGVSSPPTSSVGRLFDAVAALLDVRDVSHYEGQAAIELEQLVDPSEQGAYRATIDSDGDAHVVRGADLVAAVLEDRRGGVPRGRIAGRFHRGLAGAVVEVCERIRAGSGVAVVALSGGVFGNVVLLTDLTRRLEAAGFTVLRHRRVPTNDGGISFGQAVVAAARDRAG